MDLTSEETRLELRLAERLAMLRQARGWSLETLAERSGVSRATLSRFERAESSPSTVQLNRLCRALGMTASRLLGELESGNHALVTRAKQPLWVDQHSGLRRRSLSPPTTGYAVELIECELPAGAVIAYDVSPLAGLEHHLWLIEGALELEIEGRRHRLAPGDVLRYRLYGEDRFEALEASRYLLAIHAPQAGAMTIGRQVGEA